MSCIGFRHGDWLSWHDFLSSRQSRWCRFGLLRLSHLSCLWTPALCGCIYIAGIAGWAVAPASVNNRCSGHSGQASTLARAHTSVKVRGTWDAWDHAGIRTPCRNTIVAVAQLSCIGRLIHHWCTADKTSTGITVPLVWPVALIPTTCSVDRKSCGRSPA